MKIILVLLLLIVPPVISAKPSYPDNDSLKTYQTDEIVITGSRTEIEKSKLPASISIISRTDLEQSRQFNILPVLNRQVPGLFLNDRTVMGYGVGPASSGTMSIRGISGNPNTRVLTLIDGQPQFMGIFGHPVYDQFTSSDIEKVEIIRGPGSILYGSNAMGGTINIITRRQHQDGVKFNLNGSYGSFNTYTGSASAGYKKGNCSIFGAFNLASTDGHRSDGDDMFKSMSGFLKAAYNLSGSFNLSVDGNISASEFYDPGRITKPLRGSFYDYDRGRGAVSLENNIFGLEGAIRYFYSSGNHDFYDGWNSTDYISGITFYQNYRFSGKHTITLGTDYKNYGGKGTNSKLPPAASKGLARDQRIEEIEYYALARLIFPENITADAGYRIGRNSMFGWQSVPQFGITYKADDVTVIKVSAGKAFRNPSVLDLFLFPVSNEKLAPEESWNYEAGVSRSFLGGLLHSEITVFQIEGDKLIEEIQAGLIRRKQNTGSFIHRGVEAEIRLMLSEAMRVYSNYSFLNTKNNVLYAPGHLVNLQAEYTAGIININAGLKYVKGLFSSLQPLQKENYYLLNSAVSFRLQNRIDLYVKGDNILGRKYQIDYNYPMPGAVWAAGFRINY